MKNELNDLYAFLMIEIRIGGACKKSRHSLYLSRSSESDLLDAAREWSYTAPPVSVLGLATYMLINWGLLESFGIYSDL